MPKKGVCEPEYMLSTRVEALMDERPGLTEAALLDKLSSKLDAMETVFAKFEGQITDRVDVEAHGVQLHALDMALKLRKMYPATEMRVGNPDGTPLVDPFSDIERAARIATILDAARKRRDECASEPGEAMDASTGTSEPGV